jgi:ABC-type branched-subunit amino acid transport system ATPase component
MAEGIPDRRTGHSDTMSTVDFIPQLLKIDAIGKNFGGIVALGEVSFRVAPKTIVGLIGTNGSGKTTLLNVVNSVFAPDRGQVRLGDVSITGKRPCELATLGLSRTFQSARVFSTLTVLQNMFIPLLHAGELQRRNASQRATELIEFVGLSTHANSVASELSGGQQRLLEFARALITCPRLILMDEPFAGVHPGIKATLINCIRETVQREGTSFLIVSHEVPDLVAMSDEMICLVEGKIAAIGLPADVIGHHKVIEGYLGRE